MENHSLLDGFYDHCSLVTYYTTWVKWRIISTRNVKILTTQLLDLLVSQTNPAQVTKLTIEPVIKIFFWIVQSVGHCHLYGRNVQMFCIISLIFYVKFVLIIFKNLLNVEKILLFSNWHWNYLEMHAQIVFF